jgi:hypothetical protein
MAIAFAFAFVVAACECDCATVIKTDNTANLNLGASWTNNVAPTSTDIAQWDNNVTAANTVSLGADLEWLGLKIINPGGPITLTAGNTLTLNGSGADLSVATQDLTLNL